MGALGTSLLQNILCTVFVPFERTHVFTVSLRRIHNKLGWYIEVFHLRFSLLITRISKRN